MSRLKILLISLVAHLPVALFFLLCGIVCSVLVYGQPVVQYQAPAYSNPLWDIVPGSHSVWFFVFIIWYFFSAITAGMPEPTIESSPWYVWAYRTFHILAASGTSYFQNKMYWPRVQQSRATVITTGDPSNEEK